MKLFYKVLIRLAVLVTIVLGLWSVFFYYAMMNEVTDEIDDSLEDYTDLIITRSLAGETLPEQDMGTNNQYFLKEVDSLYAVGRPAIMYRDSMVYIGEKKETEPARILTTIFRDSSHRYFQLEVSVPTIERADLRQSIFYLIIALYVILLFSFMLINVFVFNRSMKPFFKLTHWLENNRLGDNEGSVPGVSTTTVEFQKLNDAITGYALHSEKVYQQQKQFIGNASHEMQTPVAVCLSRVETMMEDETLSEEQMAQLAKMHSTLEYVTRLNKSLLLLSRIDNNQFVESTEINITELMEQYLADYREVYGYKGIDVVMTGRNGFIVCMSRTLAEILVTNLVKNAFVHTQQGGAIEIECTGQYVEIRNAAAEGPLDGEKIFERFYQGRKKEGSTGLGLAIADTICRNSNLKISYNFYKNFHCFRIFSESGYNFVPRNNLKN